VKEIKIKQEAPANGFVAVWKQEIADSPEDPDYEEEEEDVEDVEDEEEQEEEEEQAVSPLSHLYQQLSYPRSSHTVRFTDLLRETECSPLIYD
jgi:hypothetical protein